MCPNNASLVDIAIRNPTSAPQSGALDVSMFPVLAASALAAFQIAITYWLWRSRTYIRSEKIAQTKLIWLLPCLGAAFVAIMLFEDVRQQG